MTPEAFLENLRNGKIPSEPPDGCSAKDFGFPLDIDKQLALMKYRHKCLKYGMWPIVDNIWTKVLADWIGKQTVLEIMAGAGWLSKALSVHGVAITTTDDYSWGTEQQNIKRVFPVQNQCALTAVKRIDADILLVSWPPYESNIIVDVCDLWGNKNPIIYIGEGKGGCNAPDDFFDYFSPIRNTPPIPLACWFGIHDQVTIGKWKRVI